MSNVPKAHGRLLVFAAGLAVTALVLAACLGTPEHAADDGNSVPHGASKADWQAAFEAIDSITIVTQVQGGKGTPNAAAGEAYWASVEEYSGGKIKPDVSYANALVPVTEADKGIADGLVDASPTLPTFNPESWPAFNAMATLGYLSSPNPLLQIFHQNAWQLEVGYGTPEILAEYNAMESAPIWTSDSVPPSYIYCAEPRVTLDELSGTNVLASSPAQVDQVSAVGMTAVSLSPAEAYEALQRGVLDCVAGSLSSALTSGNFEAAPYLLESREAAIIATPAGFGVNLEVWEGLPLIAQQLLFDRMGI